MNPIGVACLLIIDRRHSLCSESNGGAHDGSGARPETQSNRRVYSEGGASWRGW